MAQQNRLRIFMFNQYSVNAFNNQEFHGLCCMTIDLLTHVMTNNQYASLEAASNDLIPKMVEMLCVLNLRLYPALEACINPGAENGIRQVIATYDTWSQCMNHQFTQRYRAQNMVGGGGWASNNVNMDTRPVFSRGSPSTGHSTGSVFNNSGPRATVINAGGSNQGSGREYGGRYSERSQPVQQPQQQVVQQVVQQNTQPESISWYPSAKYPYLPAYNPNRYNLVLVKENGIVTPSFEERKVEMDYDRHATGPVSSFGTMPKGTDISGVAAAMTKIHSAVEEVNKATEAEGTDDPEIKVTTKISQQWACETSEEGAWFSAELKRFDETVRSENVMPAIYRCYADLAQPILASSENIQFVKNLANAKAFTVAREMIVNADDVNPELLMICKDRLTKLVNRILKQQLSIPKLEIEDFCEDLAELTKRLKAKFGDPVSEAFLKFQKEQLASLFRLQTDDETRRMTEAYMEGDVPEDRLVPNVLFLTSAYSLTLVNCLSYQLEIELNPEVAVMVTPKGNPVLFDLLAGLFDAAAMRLQKNQTPISRHLLKTIDGRILEATQGSIGDNKAHLLTLLK